MACARHVKVSVKVFEMIEAEQKRIYEELNTQIRLGKRSLVPKNSIIEVWAMNARKKRIR